ncbi:uncharacterized protein LOC116265779 [Nymphaea colorata]|nr:uncharacterized protein LOC116265779 [Nymphaea colorata]
MVLWEITVATAYFLGLKRTYRLALRIQRRLIGPTHPKLRDFAHRRTRAVFDMALTVHRKVQQRDLDVGRSLGNWILRWLDRMRPSAQIRGEPTPVKSQEPRVAKTIKDSQRATGTHGANNRKIAGQDSDGRVLATPMKIMLPRLSPTVGAILHPQKASGISGSHYRHIYVNTGHVRAGRYDGIFRRDIAQWMQVRYGD